MGYDAVKTALAASKGEQVPAQVYIDASLITKANMNSARSQLLSCNDLHAFRVVIRFRVLLRGQYFLDGIGRDHRAPRNRRQTNACTAFLCMRAVAARPTRAPPPQKTALEQQCRCHKTSGEQFPECRC